MSLIPISPATFQCTFSKVATKSEAKNSPRTMRSWVRDSVSTRPAVRVAALRRRS